MVAVKKYLSYFMIGIVLFVFVFSFLCSMSYSYDCFASIRVIIYSVIGAVLILGTYTLFAYLSHFRKLMKFLMIAAIGLFTLLCLFLNFTCRNDIFSIIDYGYVVTAAEEYAQIGSSFDYSYFLNFPVNFFLMFVLAGLIRISYFFGIGDFFYLFAAVSTFIQTITLVSCTYLAYRYKKRLSDAIILILIMITFLPMYALMPFLYTDMLTFGIIPVVFSLHYLANDSKNDIFRWIARILGGAILAFGILVKFTVLIPIIALVIIMFLNTRKVNLILPAIVCAIGLMLGNFFINSHDFVAECKKTQNPVSAWIVTGMSEDGSFAKAYNGYLKEMYDYNTTEEKDAYCKEYLRNNYKVLFDFSHIVKKTKRVYGLCDFGVTEYEITAAEGYEYNRIYMYFSKYEKRYHQILDFTSAHLGSILLIYIIGVLFEIRTLITKKEKELMIDVIDLAFVGYFLFLMISETSHHQIFNLMPLLFVGVGLHINRIMQIGANTMSKDAE